MDKYKVVRFFLTALYTAIIKSRNCRFVAELQRTGPVQVQTASTSEENAETEGKKDR